MIIPLLHMVLRKSDSSMKISTEEGFQNGAARFLIRRDTRHDNLSRGPAS